MKKPSSLTFEAILQSQRRSLRFPFLLGLRKEWKIIPIVRFLSHINAKCVGNWK